MAENPNGRHFKRDLDPGFMHLLECEVKKRGWFAEVLEDDDLILGLRGTYVNVYRYGQSLFKIERNGKAGLKITTHPKYLLNPDLYKPVPFLDGSKFDITATKLVVTGYERIETLRRMKRAAELYCGDEKRGVHAIACVKENNVIDTEIAFSREAEGTERNSVPRIDLACFEDSRDGRIRLRFWEAKLYSNHELRAAGETDAPVVGQVRKYRELLEKHPNEVVESYREVAKNLVEIGSWSSKRKPSKLVEQVAKEGDVIMDPTPMVGLVVYDYNAAEKKSWTNHLKKLEAAHIPVQYHGKAKKIRLLGDGR